MGVHGVLHDAGIEKHGNRYTPEDNGCYVLCNDKVVDIWTLSSNRVRYSKCLFEPSGDRPCH
jgi:hypothetical protein